MENRGLYTHYFSKIFFMFGAKVLQTHLKGITEKNDMAFLIDL